MGGLSGVMFAAIPFDQQVTDTYFIVAHFHFVIFGAAVFPILGGLYYWFPKVTGRMYHEGIGHGSASGWRSSGTTLTFFPMHILGLIGMPRRAVHLSRRDGLDGLEPARDDRLLHPRRRARADRGEPRAQPVPRRAVGARPVEGADARMGDQLAAARVQLRGHPGGDEPVPDVGSRGPRRRPARARPRRARLRARASRRPTSSVLDGEWDEVLEPPSESGKPIILALALGALFTMLLLEHWVTAGVFAAVAALVLVWWHWTEAEPAARAAALAAARRVGHGAADLHRGRAVLRADRLLLVPALPRRRTGRRRASRTRRSRCR